MDNFDTERFIIEIQSRTSIWDNSSSEYSDRDLIKKCWEEVVALFGEQSLQQTVEQKKGLGTMKFKDKLVVTGESLVKAVDEKFFSQFGFYMKDASFPKIVEYMYEPKDSSSLAVTRILFGLAMLFDIPDERGGAILEKRWGDPNVCHFPLFPFLQAIPMPYMAIVYAALWLGAIGIMLGYKYRLNAVLFTTCYWYLFLIEKSYWNNHSYLFGLVALLLTCTEANCYWSIDVFHDPSKMKTTVPYWNYFILKYQFFILYFMAGLKKATKEWLSEYAMQNLSEHWVFDPFKLFLTVPQIDYFIVHWYVFMFDLTIAMWMMWSKSRPVATVFCALFHLMNTRLFTIGMFPWVCLAAIPLFYPFDWPKLLSRKLGSYLRNIKANIIILNNVLFDKVCKRTLIEEKKDEKTTEKPSKTDFKPENNVEENDIFSDTKNFKEINELDDNGASIKVAKNNNEPRCYMKRRTIYFIIFFVVTQAFLPFSHFITKGYNNWSNGLYGYSWDMMVHNWDTHAVIIKLVDNEKQAEFYINPDIYTPTRRWATHGDMVYQYAKCLREKLEEDAKNLRLSDKLSQNLSIYVDVWCSLNGRVIQRHFDPKIDMLKTEWSPFETISYLMPLLDESLDWRRRLDGIKANVLTWSNKSDVLVLADFPGYELEKFISPDLRNVSLTILEGEVIYQPQVTKLHDGLSYKLTAGDDMPLDLGTFHKVYNIGEKPALYMYTFYNSTEIVEKSIPKPKLPILKELAARLIQMFIFIHTLVRNIGNIIFCLCNCK